MANENGTSCNARGAVTHFSSPKMNVAFCESATTGIHNNCQNEYEDNYGDYTTAAATIWFDANFPIRHNIPSPF